MAKLEFGKVARFEAPSKLFMQQMTFYAIEESQFKSLTAFNDRARAYYRQAHSLVFLGIGLILEACFVGSQWSDVSTLVKVLALGVGPTCIVVGAIRWSEGRKEVEDAEALTSQMKAKSGTKEVAISIGDVEQSGNQLGIADGIGGQ